MACEATEWDAARIWAGLRQHGAVIARGASDGAAEFTRLTTSLATNFQVHHSPCRRSHATDGTTQSVHAGGEAIALHAERAYLPGRPELLFLYCVEPASLGGETTLCDGSELLDRLAPHVRRQCAAARVSWHTTIAKDSWNRSWASMREVDEWFEAERKKDPDAATATHWLESDTLCVAYECPLIHQGWIGGRRAFASYLLLREPDGPSATLANGDPIPESWLAELQATADDVTTHVTWHRGDVLIVDNTRYLHGRRAVTAGERVILARMGDARPELRDLHRWNVRADDTQQADRLVDLAR